jgi:hypothetical protein
MKSGLLTILRVNNGHDFVWEYHENRISVGALYTSKQRLEDAITSWAISTQRVFKIVVSSKKYLTVEYTKIDVPQGCTTTFVRMIHSGW